MPRLVHAAFLQIDVYKRYWWPDYLVQFSYLALIGSHYCTLVPHNKDRKVALHVDDHLQLLYLHFITLHTLASWGEGSCILDLLTQQPNNSSV